jgi:hypothetical protein
VIEPERDLFFGPIELQIEELLTPAEKQALQERALYPLAFKTFGDFVHGATWSPQDLDDRTLLRTHKDLKERVAAYRPNENPSCKYQERDEAAACLQEIQGRKIESTLTQDVTKLIC